MLTLRLFLGVKTPWIEGLLVMTGLLNRFILRPEVFLRPSASFKMSLASRFLPSRTFPLPVMYSPRTVGCFPRPSSDRHATAGFASANLRTARRSRRDTAEGATYPRQAVTPPTLQTQRDARSEMLEDELSRASRAAAVWAVAHHKLLELQHTAIHWLRATAEEKERESEKSLLNGIDTPRPTSGEEQGLRRRCGILQVDHARRRCNTSSLTSASPANVT